MNDEYVFTGIVYFFMIAFGFVINIAVKKSKPILENDSGIFWFLNLLVFLFIFLCFTVIYFFSTFLQSLSGHENHYILANIFGVTNSDYNIIWANIATIMWIITVLVLIMMPSRYFALFIKLGWHKALVGTISSNIKSRKWIVYLFLPSLIFSLALPILWKNFNQYPFFIYNSGLVLTIIICLIAFSEIKEKSELLIDDSVKKEVNNKELWEEKLREEGVELEFLGMLPNVSPQNYDNIKENNFILRANSFLKNGGSEELLECIKDILKPGAGVRERHKQIRAQDECGQIESVAMSSEALFLRYYTMTLLVVPEEKINNIRLQLADFFDEDAGAGRVFILGTGTPYPKNDTSMIILTDAKTLSDSFMDVLVSDELLLQRIGLVVWWDLHEYSGVLAANMWAIIHRLHRLIEIKGRDDIRVLSFIRQAHHEEAELGRFSQDLLPFEFYPESIVDISVKQAHTLYLYKLNGIKSDDISPLPRQEHQHVLLYATRASIMAGWKTYLMSASACLTDEETSIFLKRKEVIFGREKPEKISKHIPLSRANTDALILQLNSRNALSLVEMISSLGRSVSNKLKYVGVICNGNSYINYILLEYFKSDGHIFASQSLIAPRPNKGIVSKHLKKALFETANTRSDIKTDFQFENDYIEEVLQEIEIDNNLQTSEVRYLQDGDLRVEPEYRSLAGNVDYVIAPLDTNTAELINVIAPALGAQNAGVTQVIDSSRVTVLAYPGRVFYHEGRRFEIPMGNMERWSNWSNSREIHCIDSTRKDRTYRIRYPKPIDCEYNGGHYSTESLRNFTISLLYEEIVEGCVSISTSYAGKPSKLQISNYSGVYSERFLTKALCIEMPKVQLYEAIESIAEGLHYALPVHLGIENDVIEVLAVKDLDIENREKPFTGIILIELYSNGIGLVERLDIHLLKNTFKGIHRWLVSCSCNDGCNNCLLGEEKRYPISSKFPRKLSKQAAIKGLATL